MILIRICFYAVIPPEVEIGEKAVFSYNALGVVLNPAVKIGNNAHIGHHVTIGIRYFTHNSKIYKHSLQTGNIGVPQIGNNVTISAGARILGNIKIGDNAVIGANAVVLVDVPENATAVGLPARIISGKNSV